MNKNINVQILKLYHFIKIDDPKLKCLNQHKPRTTANLKQRKNDESVSTRYIYQRIQTSIYQRKQSWFIIWSHYLEMKTGT